MFILNIVIVQSYRQGICRETFSPGFSKEYGDAIQWLIA